MGRSKRWKSQLHLWSQRNQGMFLFGCGILSTLNTASVIFKKLTSGLICGKCRNSAIRHHGAVENLFPFMLSGLGYHLLDYLHMSV